MNMNMRVGVIILVKTLMCVHIDSFLVTTLALATA